VLALLGAAALIFGAIAVRNVFFDDDNGGGGGGGGGDVVLACVTELEDACRALAADDEAVSIVVEDAEATLQALTAGDTDYDGWLTLDPWPAIVGEGRPAQVVGDPTEPVASTEMVIAVPDGADPCPGIQIEWKCLGDRGARVGLPPRSTALGLLLVGNAASGYFGSVDIATNDMDADPAFDDWLARITANSRSDDPLAELLRVFPPTLLFDAVGTTNGRFDTEVSGSRADGRIGALEPDPLARANVVLAPVQGADDAERITDLAGNEALRDALAEAGWETGGDQPPNLPSAGVLYQLRTR
jgi:hypothetical protein